MRNVSVEGMVFGEGRPKICVPLVHNNLISVLGEIEYILALPADLIEWRIDGFIEDPINALYHIYRKKGNLPLLCTFRSSGEGGKAGISASDYQKLVCDLIDSGFCDMVDIELSWGDEIVSELILHAKKHGVVTVVSKHNFEMTPDRVELVETLEKMAQLGADLPKYAVMPHAMGDVIRLLDASIESHRKFGPVITMAMGEIGKISRVTGEFFGSCMTFGAGKGASAPGQIAVEELDAILNDLA